MTGFPQHSLENWIQACPFQTLYLLTDQSFNQLSSIESGTLRSESGANLLIRRITAEMLRSDFSLASEIYEVARMGQLGFGRDDRHIQFRHDIAEKLGESRTFKVVNANQPDKIEEMNVDIESIDQEAYEAMVAIPSELEVEDDKEDKKEKKLAREGMRETAARAASSSARSPVSKQQAITAQEISAKVIQQLRAEEETRRERAKKKEQFRSEIDDMKLRKEILQKEIKTKSITSAEDTSSQQRKDLNVGKKNPQRKK